MMVEYQALFHYPFSDGVGRTGAFMSIYTQLERLKAEQTADIFQFVKASRLQRKELIRQLVGARTKIDVETQPTCL